MLALPVPRLLNPSIKAAGALGRGGRQQEGPPPRVSKLHRHPHCSSGCCGVVSHRSRCCGVVSHRRTWAVGPMRMLRTKQTRYRSNSLSVLSVLCWQVDHHISTSDLQAACEQRASSMHLSDTLSNLCTKDTRGSRTGCTPAAGVLRSRAHYLHTGWRPGCPCRSPCRRTRRQSRSAYPCFEGTDTSLPVQHLFSAAVAANNQRARPNARQSKQWLVKAQSPNKSCNSALRKSSKRMRHSSNACASALQAAAAGAPAVSHSVAQPTHALVLGAHLFYGDC